MDNQPNRDMMQNNDEGLSCFLLELWIWWSYL